MSILTIIFGIYIVCGFFCVIQMFLTKKQLEQTMEYFTNIDNEQIIQLQLEKKAKLILGAITLTPLVNVIVGAYLTFIDPIDLFSKIHEIVTK